VSDKPKRSRINWRESRRLRSRNIPLMRDNQGDVEAYISNIIELARDLLVDMGINPKVPLDIDDRLKYIDIDKMEELADGFVAVHLLENATIVRDLMKIEAPTANQLQFAVRLMAEIADLLHMADFSAVQHLLSTPDNQERNEEICRRRYSGVPVKVLADEYGLDEKTISRIAPRKKPR
jgi:hypothetical protein